MSRPFDARSGALLPRQRCVRSTFGYLGALEQWCTDGGVHPVAHDVDERMSVLRDVWAQPANQR
jgi:hypothetical protein